MDRKKDIINTIDKMSGKYSPYVIFTDWIKCCSLSIQNTLYQFFRDELWKTREKEYMDTIGRYSKEEAYKFVEMFNMLAETMEEGLTDILGQIYMESGMGSKSTGQFFTPFHLSELTAKLAIQDQIDSFDGGKIPLNEPSAGGGGMIIAAAKVLQEHGIDYQRHLDVVAQDLDWNGVYMCYLQMSLYGISGIVVQGDTLADPYDPKTTERYRILRTPAKMGALI